MRRDETFTREEEALVRNSVRAFLAPRPNLERLRLDAPAGSAFDAETWREMAALGLFALRLDEELGGPGFDPICGVAAAEEAGSALLPEPLVACGLVPGALARRLPPGGGRDEIVSGLMDGATRTTLCWQTRTGQLEPERGSLELDGAGRLRGEGAFVPNANLARWLAVLAYRGDQPVLIAVDANASGIARQDRRLGDGGKAAVLQFDETPSSHVLAEGPAALASVQGALNEGALYAAAYLCGLGRGVLERTLEHLRTRRQFGRPLGAFQTLQHQCVDMHLALRLAQASTRRAALRLESQGDQGVASAAVSAAKARAGASAISTCRTAIQMFGGLGFAEETGLGAALRVAMQYAVAFGAPTPHLRRFGRLSQGLAA